MPKRDTRDLQERNGWWHFSKRIPNTKIYTRKSLKTKNLKEAQAKRDALLIELKEVLAKGEKAKGVIALRKSYTNAVSEGERDYLEEEIIDAAEDKAIRCCQTNAKQSPNYPRPPSSGSQLTPFGQSGRTIFLEEIAAV
jgi:hypothetical protein